MIKKRQIPSSKSQRNSKHKLQNNLLPAKGKRNLLPAFMRAMQESDWGLRNNAAIALRYYPELRELVVPVLTNAVHDSKPNVALLSAVALNRVAPDTIKTAGVLPIVIQILKNPNDQVAYQAAELLGEMKAEPSLAVPALIESLQGTNDLVATHSAAALAKFVEQSATIIPALEQAAQRKDYVGGRAKRALEQIKSASQEQKSQP